MSSPLNTTTNFLEALSDEERGSGVFQKPERQGINAGDLISLSELECFSPAKSVPPDFRDASRQLISEGRMRSGQVVRFAHVAGSRGRVVEVIELIQKEKVERMTIKVS
ncbi:MAG: hypothetical protein OEY44_05005 [Candidatus Peregrinibacteria bacterium]|nr:hypothetical protein [Candidatus Peregrinibacteria bacterium]